MTVTYFQRKAEQSNHFSLEQYFDVIRAEIAPEITSTVYASTHGSRGLWRRAANVVEAVGRQGAINHITGDAHYLALFLRRGKTILTIADCGFEQRPPGLRRDIVRRFWYTWPAPRVAAVTVISGFTRSRLLALVPACDPARVHVIPVCISPLFTPAPPTSMNARPRLLHVGTAPNKNIERLAAALEGLDVHLRIVGNLSESQRRALGAHRIEHSSVSRIPLTEMVDEYRRADLVTFVSTYEGFGMPIVEANAVGRPVVTSTVASMPEVAGDAALLVDPYDVASIRAGIVQALESESVRAGLISRGYANVTRFDPGTIAAQFVELYRKVAALPR